MLRIASRPYARMTRHSVSGIVRWIVLALALMASARVAADDSRPLDLDATRTALTAIELALKDQNSHGRGSAASPHRERPARRRLAGSHRRHDAEAGGVGETAYRVDAEVEGRRAGDRRGGRRTGERETEARHARRESARGAGDAVADGRQCDANRGETTRALRAPNLRQILEHLQSAIVAERLARGADRLPRDGGVDRRLACRRRRASDGDAGPSA